MNVRRKHREVLKEVGLYYDGMEEDLARRLQELLDDTLGSRS